MITKEYKNQLFSHMPLFLIPIGFIVIPIIPHEFICLVLIFIFSLLIIQGFIFVFKKKVYAQVGYLSKFEKTVYGSICIIGGVVAEILILLKLDILQV